MSAPTPRRFRRSPHVLVRWADDAAILLHADSLAELRCHPELVALLSSLGDWSTAAELAARGPAVSEAELGALCLAGVIETQGDGSAPAGDLWDPLELAVHRRTSRAPAGDLAADVAPVKRPLEASRSRVSLEDPPRLRADLAGVLRTRRTLREYASRPLRLPELSSLLHHAARELVVGDRSRRPYAAAGARSELELYVVANDVEGLKPGAWRYDASDHELVQLRAAAAHRGELSRWVDAATGGQLSRDPPAIVLVTATFERMAGKYGHLALSLVYKDVGCLLQNLYLVATALGLAPCAIGGADERANCAWLGLDALAQPQVGCFAVGPA